MAKTLQSKQTTPVLCVEDDQATLKQLVHFVGRRFERVLQARDGREGLELFREHQPELVITDIEMPRMDGLAMAKEIRKLAPGARILITTSHGAPDLLLSAIQVGVTDYILKPFTVGRLDEALAKCLQVTLQERQLRFLAYFDRLTNLPNRVLLQDRLQQAIARCGRENQTGAVLFMDLDGFKNINDSLGHVAGDRVLQVVANRLQTCIRSCDTVARLGGDEFVVLVDGLDHPKHLPWVVERILSALARDIQIQEGFRLSLSASIGVSLIPADGATVEELLQAADTAMYASKKHGGNTYQLFRKAQVS